jgi:hypothetical protein
LIDAGEAMTVGPSLQIPETPPESAKRPSASLIYCAAANLTWLIAWPFSYAVFLESAAPENKVAHWLSVSGFTLWALSLFTFYGFLLALADYSPTPRILLRGLEFVFEVLWFLIDVLSFLA